MWARAPATVATSGQMIVWKKTGDSSDPSTTDMAALGDWDNKKNILHTFMGLLNDDGSVATPIFKGWIKIPKGKQRQGLGDALKMSIFAPTTDWTICGFFTYKEYH